MPPASVMTIESTDAKIGRSMKKREIKADPPGGVGTATESTTAAPRGPQRRRRGGLRPDRQLSKSDAGPCSPGDVLIVRETSSRDRQPGLAARPALAGSPGVHSPGP